MESEKEKNTIKIFNFILKFLFLQFTFDLSENFSHNSPSEFMSYTFESFLSIKMHPRIQNNVFKFLLLESVLGKWILVTVNQSKFFFFTFSLSLFVQIPNELLHSTLLAILNRIKLHFYLAVC